MEILDSQKPQKIRISAAIPSPKKPGNCSIYSLIFEQDKQKTGIFKITGNRAKFFESGKRKKKKKSQQVPGIEPESSGSSSADSTPKFTERRS